ncbi:MAG: DNA primase [Peptostreptococcaceae bacterium]|nr:DNA primase [Peptostreptococcaceae bacterium]
MQELFQTKHGRTIMDEDLSNKMYKIKQYQPEKADDNSSGFEWSEMGMANLFGLLYNREVRFCPEHKSWYSYFDGVWRKDESAILVSEKIKDFVRLMIIYCGEIEDDELRKKYTTFVNKMGDRRMRDRILRDATGELRISAVEFDNNPYLVNCLNGTYNLKDFTFKEHNSEDFLTMQTNFKHTVSHDIKCERWETFIDEITENNKEKADFLQRALGYSLLGMSNEECMFILHGKTTRNGKSTLLNTIETMLGDYAKVAPVGMICRGDRRKDAEAASPILAGLKGKRFVTMAESNEYGKLDEEKIKQLTGGENISARELHQSPITFKPQFSLWLSCNDLPMVTDKSLFASERIKVVEFNRHFKPEEQDVHLKDELSKPENMSGIFMWLIRGYRKYKSKGLTMSKALKEVIKNYEKENDIVLQFLESRCEKDVSATIRAKDLYQAFKIWAKSEGAYVISARKFNSEMEKHPEWFERKSTSSGFVIYWGLKLKEAM